MFGFYCPLPSFEHVAALSRRIAIIATPPYGVHMRNEEISTRVRELIKQSGLSDAEFAARVGLDGPKLSKSLNGERRFTTLNLARIAELGGTSVDWLLGREAPTPALAARHESGGVINDRGTRDAIAKATEYAQFRADLASIGIRQEVSAFLRSGRGGSYITDGEKLAAEATEFLRSNNVDHTGSRDLFGLIEKWFGVDVAVVHNDGSFDGLTWHDECCRLIVIGTSSVPGRQRFTLAHELAHLLAEDDQRLTVDEAGAERRHPSEIRANTFAASFLMPEDTISERLNGKQIDKDAFARLSCDLFVTPSTLAWRLFNLKMIDSQTRQELGSMRTMDAAVLGGQTAQFSSWIEDSLAARIPQRLVEDAGRAYLDGKTTLRPFANLVGVDVAVLRDALEAERSELAGPETWQPDEKDYVLA